MGKAPGEVIEIVWRRGWDKTVGTHVKLRRKHILVYVYHIQVPKDVWEISSTTDHLLMLTFILGDIQRSLETVLKFKSESMSSTKCFIYMGIYNCHTDFEMQFSKICIFFLLPLVLGVWGHHLYARQRAKNLHINYLLQY